MACFAMAYAPVTGQSIDDPDTSHTPIAVKRLWLPGDETS